MSRKRCSELKFSTVVNAEYSGFIKVVWNGETIYDDADDGLYIYHKLVKKDKAAAIKAFEDSLADKTIYSVFIRVVEFHHTEIYIEGEK